MNSLEVAQTLALPTGYLGGRWLASKATYAYGDQLGFRGRSFYYLGRGAALGDVRPEVVTSSMIFFPSYVVEPLWLEGREVMEPAEGLAAFSQCCWQWGRDRLSGAAELERTTQLLAKAVDTANGAALALFSGWRQAPRPEDDLPALAAHLMQVLREFRGGSHGLAVLASGLTPVEAAVAGTREAGVASPETVGWEGPLPERTDELVARRAAAEDLTNVIVARVFAGLDDQERAELVERVNGLTAAVAASSKASPKTG